MIVDTQPKPEDAAVFVIDNDPSVHNAIAAIARQMGLRCQPFTSGLEFLDSVRDDTAGCVVSEVRMADIGGLQLQRRLAAAGCTMPFIFLTAHGSIPAAVRAVREGAVEFFEKPLQEQPIWEALQQALRIDRQRRTLKAENNRLRALLDSFTTRERKVLQMVVEGFSNRQIADQVDISLRTVEVERSRLMRKLGAANLQDLIRTAVVIHCRITGCCQLGALGRTSGNGKFACPAPAAPPEPLPPKLNLQLSDAFA